MKLEKFRTSTARECLCLSNSCNLTIGHSFIVRTQAPDSLKRARFSQKPPFHPLQCAAASAFVVRLVEGCSLRTTAHTGGTFGPQSVSSSGQWDRHLESFESSEERCCCLRNLYPSVLTGTLNNFGTSQSKALFREANALSEHKGTKIGLLGPVGHRRISSFHRAPEVAAPCLPG